VKVAANVFGFATDVLGGHVSYADVLAGPEAVTWRHA
jgi:hypothetical protein